MLRKQIFDQIFLFKDFLRFTCSQNFSELRKTEQTSQWNVFFFRKCRRAVAERKSFSRRNSSVFSTIFVKISSRTCRNSSRWWSILFSIEFERRFCSKTKSNRKKSKMIIFSYFSRKTFPMSNDRILRLDLWLNRVKVLHESVHWPHPFVDTICPGKRALLQRVASICIENESFRFDRKTWKTKNEKFSVFEVCFSTNVFLQSELNRSIVDGRNKHLFFDEFFNIFTMRIFLTMFTVKWQRRSNDFTRWTLNFLTNSNRSDAIFLNENSNRTNRRFCSFFFFYFEIFVTN